MLTAAPPITSRSLMTHHYIAIDTETGGTRPGRHALLSISAVPSWHRESSLLIYIEPHLGYTVEDGAARVNGFTHDLWIERGCVSIYVAMRQLSDWLHVRFAECPRALMLAHNAGFDRMFLDESSHLTGVRLPIRHAWRCSMDKLGTLMDRGIIPAGKANLDRLGELAGLWPVGARPAIHEADADARACLEGYEWLLKKEKEPEDALRAEIEAAHVACDGFAVRDEQDGYPEGAPSRLLPLVERIQVLRTAIDDYKGWLNAAEKKEGAA